MRAKFHSFSTGAPMLDFIFRRQSLNSLAYIRHVQRNQHTHIIIISSSTIIRIADSFVFIDFLFVWLVFFFSIVVVDVVVGNGRVVLLDCCWRSAGIVVTSLHIVDILNGGVLASIIVINDIIITFKF